MRWKHLLRFPLDIRVAEQQLESHRSTSKEDAGTIGLDLYTDHLLFDCGRHLSCLAASAKNIESNIVLRCSRVLLACSSLVRVDTVSARLSFSLVKRFRSR